MPSLSEKDRDSLELLLEVVEKIRAFGHELPDSEALAANVLHQDAILMNFILIGECVARLSSAFKVDHPEIEWQKIKNLRNKVSHDYWGVDVEMIWQIIQAKLPALTAELERILLENPL